MPEEEQGSMNIKEMKSIMGGSQELEQEGKLPPEIMSGREYLLYYELSDPLVSVPEGEEKIVNRLLWPAEFRGTIISSVVAESVLETLFTRANRRVEVPRLQGIAEEQKRELEAYKAQVGDISGLEKDDPKFRKLIFLQSRFNHISEDVAARSLEVEESDEWRRVYNRTKAAISFENVYAIRVLTQVNTENYAKLFERPETVTSTELADLFNPEYGYGRATEWALEDYLDVHLEGGLRDPKDPKNIIRVIKELKVSEVTKDEDEVKGVLEAAQQIGIEVDEKARTLRNIDLRDLQVLQKKDNIKATEAVLATVIKDHLRQKDKTLDDFTIKRGILLAEHTIEAFLLGPWLAVPRENRAKEGEIDQWEIVYGEDNLRKALGKDKDGKERFYKLGYRDGNNLPRIGWARPEEGGINDIVWLVLFRLKALDEVRQGFPGGPPAQLRALPEYLTEPFFLDRDAARVKLDKDLKVHGGGDKRGDREASALEAWYFANKLREEQGKKRVSLSEVFRNVPEGAFGRWVAGRINRQNQVREALMANLRGGKDDPIEPLFVPEYLRILNKAFQRAFGGRRVEREVTKINMVASRVISWTYASELKKINQEIVTPGQEIKNPDISLKQIKAACITSGFLNKNEWDIVDKIRHERQALTFDELDKKYSGARGTLSRRSRGRQEKTGRSTTAEDVDSEIEEIKEADRLVRLFQQKLQEEDAE